MARHQRDREDMLAEATAMHERVELCVAGLDENVVIGFRSNGAASFYFGAEPVYQFDSGGRLRRAHDNGCLFKAERGRLVSLVRQRAQGQVQLIRSTLDNVETNRFLSMLHCRLGTLREALDADRFQTVGEVPRDADVVGRVRAWLRQVPNPPSIATTPRVR